MAFRVSHLAQRWMGIGCLQEYVIILSCLVVMSSDLCLMRCKNRRKYSPAHGRCRMTNVISQIRTPSYRRDGLIPTARTPRKPASRSHLAIELALGEGMANLEKSLSFIHAACPRMEYTDKWPSFAFVEMSLVLSKLFFLYDMELLDQEFDWEGHSRHWVMWWKAPVQIRAWNARS